MMRAGAPSIVADRMAESLSRRGTCTHSSPGISILSFMKPASHTQETGGTCRFDVTGARKVPTDYNDWGNLLRKQC